VKSRRKWYLVVFAGLALLLAVLVISCGVSYTQEELDEVRTAAYAEGKDVGYTEGKETGLAELELAKQEADALGYRRGYEIGCADGYKDGFADGYKDGEVEGFDRGYDEGVDAGLGHGYTLRDPTYQEALAFLGQDTTDKNEYDEDAYVCSHFARDVCNNAETNGFRCALVVIRNPDGDHAIIAFETIDNGLVYFEPQFDDEVRVVIGKSYSQLNNYVRSSFDDTIVGIVVIW